MHYAALIRTVTAFYLFALLRWEGGRGGREQDIKCVLNHLDCCHIRCPILALLPVSRISHLGPKGHLARVGVNRWGGVGDKAMKSDFMNVPSWHSLLVPGFRVQC